MYKDDVRYLEKSSLSVSANQPIGAHGGKGFKYHCVHIVTAAANTGEEKDGEEKEMQVIFPFALLVILVSTHIKRHYDKRFLEGRQCRQCHDDNHRE